MIINCHKPRANREVEKKKPTRVLNKVATISEQVHVIISDRKLNSIIEKEKKERERSIKNNCGNSIVYPNCSDQWLNSKSVL